MKNICIAAHPDDEILWFPCHLMDLIIVCHTTSKRLSDRFEAIRRNHPLTSRIAWWGIPASGYWVQRNAENLQNLKINIETLREKIRGFLDGENGDLRIWTHNSSGEYGHVDHRVLFHTVHYLLQLKRMTDAGSSELWCLDFNLHDSHFIDQQTVEMDLPLYSACKKRYEELGCWTYYPDYSPRPIQTYKRYL